MILDGQTRLPSPVHSSHSVRLSSATFPAQPGPLFQRSRDVIERPLNHDPEFLPTVVAVHEELLNCGVFPSALHRVGSPAMGAKTISSQGEKCHNSASYHVMSPHGTSDNSQSTGSTSTSSDVLPEARWQARSFNNLNIKGHEGRACDVSTMNGARL